MSKRAPKQTLAAIDIGSNTVHLLVARGRPGQMKHLRSDSELLELGREVMLHGHIRKEKYEELLDTLLGQVRAARDMGVETILIAATGAMRAARNGKSVARRLSHALGARVHIVSGRHEARLAFLGARPVLRKHRTQLLIDSGGASTELTLARGRKAYATASMAVGASLLCSQLQNDPPMPLEWASLTLKVAEALQHVPTDPRPRSAVAIGGAAHRFEEICQRGDKPLRLRDLEKVTRRLLRHPSRRIARVTGLQPRRVALLAASALILHIVLTHYGLTRVRVEHVGLRDGIVRAYQLRGARWHVDGRDFD